MATTLTPDTTELTYFSFPIEKHEDTDTINPVDGTPDIVVYGKATDGSVDSDLQIVDPAWSGKALQEWFDTGGNLRVQHQAKRDPAGTGLAVDLMSDGHWVRSLVSEPTAKHLVRTGALRDYSIGVSYPDIRPDPSGKAMNGVITGRQDGKTKIAELSLVDRGSNFNSRFQLVKSASDGTAEFVGKMLDVAGSVMTTDDLHELVQDGVTKVTATRGVIYQGEAPGVSVTLPDDVAVSFKPSDLAKMLGRKGVTEKRNMDPNVGGGVDRDKLDESDFAGRNRSFPIVTPGDVSDAASSIGRAGSDNYSSDQLKKNIIRIARRKGSAFVAALPDSWKDGGSDKMDDVVKGAKDCPKCGKTYHADSKKRECENCGTNLPDADDAAKVDALQNVLIQVADAASGDVTVLPPAVVKKDNIVCPGCGANHDAGHNFCPECGKKVATSDLALDKNHDYTCLGCGKSLDDGEKYCPGCGKQNPGFNESEKAAVRAALDSVLKGDDVTTEPEDATAKAAAPSDDDDDDNGSMESSGSADDTPNPADAPSNSGDGDGSAAKAVKVKGNNKKHKKTKANKASSSPADGVTEAADTEPAPKHREPDGPVVESLEHDASLPTTPDPAAAKTRGTLGVNPEFDTVMRLKNLGVPTDIGKLHDLTCPCYHPDDVAKCYPSETLSTLDTDHWQQKAFDAAARDTLDKAREAALLWNQVVTLKNTDPSILMDVKSEAYKAFSDANPGPGTAPTPSTISPERFRHPYLTAGHSAASPGHDGPNTAPIPASGGISAAGYQRGFLNDGHAADSPANGTPTDRIPVPSTTGVPTRAFYTNAIRDNARQAMTAMHDHIAQTFPDVCPAFTGSPYRDETPPPAPRPVPVGVGSPVPHGAPTAKAVGTANTVKKMRRRLEKAVLAGEMTLDDARAELAAVVRPVEPEVTKAVTLDMATVETMITKAVMARDEEINRLRQQVDALAAQPEPVGPYRGMAIMPPPMTKTMAVSAPEALPNTARAEHAQQFLFQALHDQWRNDPDPTQREAALSELMKMNGIGNVLHK